MKRTLSWETERGVIVAKTQDGLVRYRIPLEDDMHSGIYTAMQMSYAFKDSGRIAGLLELPLEDDLIEIRSPYLEVAKTACERHWNGKWPLVLNTLGF